MWCSGVQEQACELTIKPTRNKKKRTGLDLNQFAMESELKIHLCWQFICISMYLLTYHLLFSRYRTAMGDLNACRSSAILNGSMLNAHTAYFVWGRLERTSLVTIAMSKHLRKRECNVPTIRVLALVQ